MAKQEYDPALEKILATIDTTTLGDRVLTTTVYTYNGGPAKVRVTSGRPGGRFTNTLLRATQEELAVIVENLQAAMDALDAAQP